MQTFKQSRIFRTFIIGIGLTIMPAPLILAAKKEESNKGMQIDGNKALDKQSKDAHIFASINLFLAIGFDQGKDALERAKIALKQGADVNAICLERLTFTDKEPEAEEISLLMQVIIKHDEKMLDLILSYRPKNLDFQSKKFKLTALHLAVGMKKSAAVKKLCAANAQLDLKDADNLTPLQKAGAIKNVEIFTILMEEDAHRRLSPGYYPSLRDIYPRKSF
jgi:hypothetical protein